MSKEYFALGLMSGSSLDGLDIAYCRLVWTGERVVDWEIVQAATLPFSEMWCARLRDLPQQSALALAKTHTYFGYYMGELVNTFIQQYQLDKIDFVASHGHTIFHQPDRRFTTQIGCGAALAATTGKRVVCDFRSQDVALSGEGAPLAPLVDKYLFANADFCLNIGGIANLSAQLPDTVLGFDVCYANQVLNYLAQQLGEPFDDGGTWARQGRVNADLLQTLQNLPFFRQKYPKSLGNEWVQSVVIPLFAKNELPIIDKLATATHHIAYEIAKAINKVVQRERFERSIYDILISGGGAFNTYLMEQIQQSSTIKLHLQTVSPAVIQFKEALLMVLMGMLRLENVPNTLISATGAKQSSIAGAVYV